MRRNCEPTSKLHTVHCIAHCRLLYTKNFLRPEGEIMTTTILFAGVPEYFVFRSWAVVFLFLEFAIVPMAVVAFCRLQISKKFGAWFLMILLISNLPIIFFLRKIMIRGALDYWTTWCLILFALSAIGSLCLLRGK